jgi:hypothetical protein
MVHELEEALEVGLADVPQDDDRVLARVRLEKRKIHETSSGRNKLGRFVCISFFSAEPNLLVLNGTPVLLKYSIG